MSLQSSMAVMKAKLAGNVPQLQALAMQGDFEAVAALKELTDKKAYAQGMANETAMSQDDTLPVLEQLVGNLEAPQSGIAAYAGGGRAFSSGDYVDPSGLDWREGENPFSRAGRRLVDMLRGAQANDITKPLFGGAPAAPPVDPRYDDRARLQALHPPKGRVSTTAPVPARKPGYSGIAAAAAPAETSPPSDGAFDPKKRMQRQEGAGMPSLPAAEDQTDDELRKHLEAMTPLQKERDALREKSRAQLEEAYNAKVKNLTPSKFDRVMEFLAGVSAKGGRSAAQALGAGALAMHGKDKARQEQLATAKELYDKASLLEQEAAVRDKMNDAEGAYKLRQQAAALQKQIAAQKSTERLQEAQANLADANARYIQDIKPGVEQTKAARVGRGGSGIAAGVKPPNPVQVERAIQARTAQLMKADPFNPMPEAQARAQAEQDVRASIAGKPATPAAPSGGVKFLGFE